METGQMLDVAVKAGEILLCSGAEIYRVEETISRICKNYNIACETFVLPTGIFISTTGSQCPASLIKRIRVRSVDLHKIEMINSFSRSLEHSRPEYDEAICILNKINSQHPYKFIIRLVTAGMTALVYTLLFRGSISEALIAMFISASIYTVKDFISRKGFFQFFEYMVSGLLAGGMSSAAVFIFSGLNIYKIIIGSIIILLPGVAMTNSIRDALHGDIASSLFRLSEAVFIAVAVGAGVGIMLSLYRIWI